MPKIPYPAGRNGYFLMSDGENIVWGSPSSSGMALDDLTDVIVGTPTAGEALIYTSGSWRNAAIPAPSSLKDIGDVNATMNPGTDSVLMWDGSQWDAGTIGDSHRLLAHSDVSENTIAADQIIVNTSGAAWNWKNIGIEIPGAGQTGLVGGYFSYNSGPPERLTLDLSVNFAGSGTASTVARSDHSHSLDDLTDVNVAGAQDDQTIVYTAGTWLPRNYNLDGLSDVTMGTPNSGEALIYTSGSWRNAAVPAPLHLYEIGDVNATMSPSDGEVLMWDGTNTRWDAGTIGDSHRLLAHSDVSENTIAADQIIVNTSGADWNWKNVGIEIPGAGQTGLTGGYFSYNSGPPERLTLDLSVNFAGSGTASTVARSDHSHSLDDLTDVSISSPTSVQYLGYNGSAWVNSTPPNTNYYLLDVDASDIASVRFNMQGTGDIYESFAHNINEHADTLLADLSTDDIMKWNGSRWVNVPIPVTNTYTGSAPIDVTGTTISLLYDSVAGALQLIGNKLAVKLGTSADTAAYGDHSHSGVYEPAFTKNSAFNKDFAGSGSATTVARSDHDHSGVYEPAFTKNSAFNKDFAGSGVATTVSRSDHTHSNYVATTGDSMSGALTVSTGTGVYNQIVGEGTIRVRFDSVSGGWARGFEAYAGSTRYMAFGHYGSVGTYNYAYIGKAFNDTSARFYPDGAAQLYYNNSLKLATTSTGATLNGSPIVNEAHRDFDKTWQFLSWSNNGTTTWNVNNGYNAYINVGTAGTTLSISNLEDGDYGVLFVNCGAASQTITFPSGTKQAGGGGNTVITSAGLTKVDIISFVYRGTALYITVGKDFS